MKNFIHYFSCFVLCINSSLISAQEVDFLNKKIRVYTTSKASDLRLTETETLSFQPATQPLETEISIFINPNKAHQTLLGIGGAITDASAVIFDGLSAAKKQELLNAYYDIEKGIGYSLLRTTIHSSDFSPESYIC